LRLIDAARDFVGHLVVLGRRLGELVQRGAKVRRDLGDLVLEDLAGEEDHEEVLVDELAAALRVRVEQRCGGGYRPEDRIAARGAEDDALERRGVLAVDHAGDLLQHRAGARAELGERHELD
jgi:hypothetical protein